eukprot:Gb_33915 [translate_table: standard]
MYYVSQELLPFCFQSFPICHLLPSQQTVGLFHHPLGTCGPRNSLMLLALSGLLPVDERQTQRSWSDIERIGRKVRPCLMATGHQEFLFLFGWVTLLKTIRVFSLLRSLLARYDPHEIQLCAKHLLFTTWDDTGDMTRGFGSGHWLFFMLDAMADACMLSMESLVELREDEVFEEFEESFDEDQQLEQLISGKICMKVYPFERGANIQKFGRRIVLPGSFNPLHEGHLRLLEVASSLLFESPSGQKGQPTNPCALHFQFMKTLSTCTPKVNTDPTASWSNQ